MKFKLTNVVHNSIGLFALILAISLTTAIAQGESSGGGRLEGTWDAVVTITDCATGNALENPVPFASIASFNRGGTTIGSTAGLPQSSRTPEHGVWKHVGGNTYLFKFKTFSFNQAGVNTGYTIVTHMLELAQANNSYTSAGTAQHFLPNGFKVGEGCSSAVGTRFEL